MPVSRSAVAALFSLVVLGGALLVLAVLQYRSIGQLADAERQRMKESVNFAANHFSDEFDRDLTRLFTSVQVPPQDTYPEQILYRFEGWASTARDPRIVRAVWFMPPGRMNDLVELDLRGHTFAPVEWPAELAAAKAQIERDSHTPGRLEVILPGEYVLLVPSGEGPRRRPQRPPPPPPLGEAPNDGPNDGPPPPRPREDPPPGPRVEGHRLPAYTIIALDRDYVTRTVLPDLTRRYFESGGERIYDVEIFGERSHEVLYRTDQSGAPFKAEVTVPIFRILRFAGGEAPPQPRETWRLAVRHRSGTLDEIVAATRRRNLITTTGVLLVLAGSALALMLMLRRAELLRRQQLEFVAGVTHELNTPLAALQSAGQNLADGVTHEPEQVARYGAMIMKESRRLGDMVGQVLEYAGMQSRRARKLSSVIDVAEVVDEAVAHSRWLCDQEGVTVDVAIDPDLPLVAGDASALSRAVQNLIGNAVKYGGAKKWVGVHARRNGAGVVIGVEDAGAGIAPDEARRVFEPFFRGRGSDRARGSGLGLTIVKGIVDEHGGSIAIGRSSRGGAAFTITLPEARHV